MAPNRAWSWKMFACATTLLCGCGSEKGTGSTSSPNLVPASRAAALDSVCRDAVNADRATLSLVALKSWADSLPCISRQTDLDAATGTAHAHFGICAESAQNTCPGWPTDTTFTREAATLKSCLASMWAEGPGSDYSTHGHYINMTNTGYTKVGCGFHTDDGATAWIDIDFR